MKATVASLLRFKLKGFHDANLLKQARIRLRSAAIPEPPTWYGALELSPPRPVPPRIQGKLKNLKMYNSPANFLGEKAALYMLATQQGRTLVRGFGGVKNFSKEFSSRQIKLIRHGSSEGESFKIVTQELEEQLATYETKIVEAYATIVQAEGGKSLSDFVASFSPKRTVIEYDAILPSSSMRTGAKDIAFMKALDELGFIKAMEQEQKAKRVRAVVEFDKDDEEATEDQRL